MCPETEAAESPEPSRTASWLQTGDAEKVEARPNDVTGDTWVPITFVAREFGRNRRTLGRWLKDPALGFPSVITLNGRLYVRRAELENWKRARLFASIPGSAA